MMTNNIDDKIDKLIEENRNLINENINLYITIENSSSIYQKTFFTLKRRIAELEKQLKPKRKTIYRKK